MAAQTPKKPAPQPAKGGADLPKRGIKNPVIYAGTIVVLVIVVIAFVFVPSVGGSAGSGGFRAIEFGRYEGKSVSYSPRTYFARQVQELNDRLRQQGLNEQNFQFYGYQIWRGAFERTVVQMAILSEVRKAGGYVTEARLDERVSEQPIFQENGKFSAARYHAASLEEKLQVRSDLEEELLTRAYYADVLGVSPSSKEIAFVKAMAKDTRTIEYASFPLSAYPDSEVAAWAKGNADLFRALKLSRITLPSSEADAAKLRKQVEDKSLAFEDAAKTRSKDAFAAQGGDEGQRYYFELVGDLSKKEDAEKVASLKKGELSPVLKTSTGSWVFFRAAEEPKAAKLDDPAVLKAARDYLGRFERGKIEDWAVAKAKAFASEASAAKTDFGSAAKKAGAAAKKAGPFPLNYGDLAVSLYGRTVPVFKPLGSGTDPELAGASTSDKFLTAAFSLAPGAVSEPIVLGERVVVLTVKEAGSAVDDATGGIDLYYPFLFQQRYNAEIRDRIMKSPDLKDDFSATYFKIFQPKQPQAQ